ncbi:hypothetical protein [Sphingopyxis sp. H115]|uniref:hypothetical protein n=1 Tax=Sphingopyxis sp. H115 TaxID=1759073 RepID=UPI000736A2B9|nr:hypothetical protein [Sphingopyxis sp. H115]KTE05498.1 hypothetical protein ATE71_18145 [Sphingopyxis sp. H115]
MLQLSSRFAVALVLLAGAAVPVAAKEKAPMPRPAQIQQLYDCREISDAAARLACFDREVGELQAADTQREITFADKETVKKTRRGLFGFDLPDLGIFGGDDEDKVKSVETTVASASNTPNGGYRIEMADGSVWVQIDNNRMPLAPRPGQKILIKTASLGTYFLSLEGRPSIRVRRER